MPPSYPPLGVLRLRRRVAAEPVARAVNPVHRVDRYFAVLLFARVRPSMSWRLRGTSVVFFAAIGSAAIGCGGQTQEIEQVSGLGHGGTQAAVSGTRTAGDSSTAQASCGPAGDELSRACEQLCNTFATACESQAFGGIDVPGVYFYSGSNPASCQEMCTTGPQVPSGTPSLAPDRCGSTLVALIDCVSLTGRCRTEESAIIWQAECEAEEAALETCALECEARPECGSSQCNDLQVCQGDVCCYAYCGGFEERYCYDGQAACIRQD